MDRYYHRMFWTNPKGLQFQDFEQEAKWTRMLLTQRLECLEKKKQEWKEENFFTNLYLDGGTLSLNRGTHTNDINNDSQILKDIF